MRRARFTRGGGDSGTVLPGEAGEIPAPEAVSLTALIPHRAKKRRQIYSSVTPGRSEPRVRMWSADGEGGGGYVGFGKGALARGEVRYCNSIKCMAVITEP